MNTIERKIQQFFAQYPAKKLHSGQIIATPGNPLEQVHYVLSGRVEQYDVSSKGNKLTVNNYGPGSYIPMSLVFGQKSDAWFFAAADDSVTMTAPSADVKVFMQQNTEVLYSFAQRLCSGAIGQQRRMAHLMGGSATSRLLYELIILFKRYGQKTGDRLTLQCTDAFLAEATGLSRETVSREMVLLKKDQLINRTYKNISTKTLSLLESKLGHTV